MNQIAWFQRAPLARRLVAAAALALVSVASLAAGKYPADPVSLVVPYPAGGVGDTTGRIFARAIGQTLGSSVIVENIGGAAGAIGAAKVLNARADGATVFQGSQNELILAPMINEAIHYKPTDFQSLQPVTITPLVLMVRPGLAVNSVDEFLALAKKRSASEPLTYGTTGLGSLYHLVSARMAKSAGVTMTHVPYKGGAPLLQDLMGDRIDFTAIAYQTSMKQLADKGKLKLLAIFSKDKPQALANLPVISETPVFKDFDYASYVGYFVKKGTSPEIAQQLNRAFAQAVQDRSLIEKIEADGRSMAKPMSLEEAQVAYENEVKKYADIVKASGVHLE